MVKVIKPGQKEFYATCDMCGCEFTYELSDLKLSCSSNKVACPTCGKDYYHKPQNGGGYGIDYINWPKGAEPIPCTDQPKDPCADCDWMKTLLKNGTYVGDTPCTWCNKNKFSCNTSGGSILQSGSYSEAHLTDCNCGPNAVCSKCSGTSGTITTASNADSCCTTSKEQNNTTKTVNCLCQGDVWKSCDDCQGGCSGSDNSISELMKPACKMYKYEG